MAAPSYLTAPYLLTSPNYTMSAIGASSDRRVGVIIALRNLNDATLVSAPTSVSIGGVTANKIFGSSAIGQAQNVTFWEILESQIGSMSGTNVVFSGQVNATIRTVAAYVIKDVHQVIVGNSAQSYKGYSSGNTPVSLARAANSLTVSAAWVADTPTLSNPTKALTLSTGTYLNIGYQSDTSNTSDSSYSNVTSNTLFIAVNYLPVPAYGISVVNGDNKLNAGTSNTATVAGYVVGTNPVISGTVGTLSLTSVSQTGTTATFTIPNPTNNSFYPQPDASNTLTLTDGTNAATYDAVMNSIAGYTSVLVVSPDNVYQNKLGYWATVPPVNSDRFMYDPSFWTVGADGSYSGATDGATTIWYHWVAATSKIYIYEATISSGGGIIVNTGNKNHYIGFGIGIGF